MDCSQPPLSMEFSRQEYWNGLPCPPPGDLPDPGIEPGSTTLQADSLPSEAAVKSHSISRFCYYCATTILIFIVLGIRLFFFFKKLDYCTRETCNLNEGIFKLPLKGFILILVPQLAKPTSNQVRMILSHYSCTKAHRSLITYKQYVPGLMQI